MTPRQQDPHHHAQRPHVHLLVHGLACQHLRGTARPEGGQRKSFVKREDGSGAVTAIRIGLYAASGSSGPRDTILTGRVASFAFRDNFEKAHSIPPRSLAAQKYQTVPAFPSDCPHFSRVLQQSGPTSRHMDIQRYLSRPATYRPRYFFEVCKAVDAYSHLHNKSSAAPTGVSLPQSDTNSPRSSGFR